MMRAIRMKFGAFALILATSSAAAAPARAPETPDLPPAKLSLRIDAPAAGGPWKMVVTNTGGEMLRLAADGRLLRFEVRPPPNAEPDPAPKKGKRAKKDAAVECRAPASLRPNSVDEDRVVALPPGARYEEAVDPALFCFEKNQREALVAGATVVPTLGFVPAPPKRGEPAKQRAPFVAEPTSAATAFSPLKEIIAPAFTVAAPPKPGAPAPAPKDEHAEADPGAPRIEISAPRWVDSEASRSLSYSVTIANAGKRALLARIRTENLAFDVDGPGGPAECRPWDGQRTLVRDFFKTMAPGARESMTVLLAEVCPDDLFATPGIYKVTPRITLADQPGQSPVRSWAGNAVAAQPSVVRVRTGSRPFYQLPPQVLTGAGASK
jgi:hypothetical protein